MDDNAPPRGTSAPGVPRPRTRGARRRDTPSGSSVGFPLLSMTHRSTTPATAASRGSSASSSFHQVDPRDEEAERAHGDALRSRLLATGMKRTIVQAQLFPETATAAAARSESNQRDAITGRPSRPQSITDRSRSPLNAVARNAPFVDNNADNKPLVSTPRHPTGGALIPSRPTTSSALQPQSRRVTRSPPHSAREVSAVSSTLHNDAAPPKVPMTARDRYYLDKRATTAPTSSELQGNKHRAAVTDVFAAVGADSGSVAKVEHDSLSTNNLNATQESDMARFHPKAATVELPRRHELLARTGEFKTLTESIAEQLHERSASLESSDAGVGIAAVPRDSFLYLRRVDSNPYNLTLTTHARIDPNDYYTVSRLGVTHFAHRSSEFQTIETFERENYIYSLLVQLPFFKRYRIWKRFTLWKHALNKRKRADARAALQQNLFILLPHLHDALLLLRQSCLDLQRIHLFEFATTTQPSDTDTRTHPLHAQHNPHQPHQQQKTLTLTEFSTRLKAQKIESERRVDEFIAQAEVVAKDACEKFLYAFLQGTGFNEPAALQSARPSVSRDAHRASQVRTPRDEARRKSMLAALPTFDPDAQMTYTERATMRTQCRRVTQFLRVVEFFIGDALLRLAIASTERLRRDMEAIKTESIVARDIGDEVVGDRARQQQQQPVALPGLSAYASVHRPVFAPLFRVDVNLVTTAPPMLGTIAARSSRAVGSHARFVRRNSGFSTLNPAKLSTPSSPTHAAQGSREGEGGSALSPSDSSSRLTLAPDAELLRSQVETLIFTGLKAVTTRDRLMSNSMFKVYVAASRDDGPGASGGDDDRSSSGSGSSESMDLDILVMEDAAFGETLEAINVVVLDAFDVADARCCKLAPFLDQYKANVAFCKRLTDSQHLDAASAEDFRDLLEQYAREIQAFDALPDTSACGLLLLDKARLNAMLKPSPRRCLERLHALLPVVLRHRNESFMAELSASNEHISAIPASVDEFAATLAYLRQLQAGMDAFDDRYAALRSLYQVADDFGVKTTDVDQTNAFLVSQKRAQLRTSMDLFDASCEQYTTKFAMELETRTPALATQLAQLATALAHDSVFALESAPTVVITYLEDVATRLRALEDAVEQHYYYERTLALPQTQAFAALSDVRADLQLKLDLWQALSAWTTSVAQWAPLEFPTHVDVGAIADAIEGYSAQIAAWERERSPGMHVLCAHLKAKVDAYRLTMPILTDLRCSSFEPRHFAELEALLGFSIQSLESDHLRTGGSSTSSTVPLTLGALVAMQLVPFAQPINRITTEATHERRLKELLDKVAALWEPMTFDVKPYKDVKDAFVLAATETLYANLEESLVSMTAILSSKYVAPIRDAARTWQTRLTVFQDTLDAWLECQRKWTHLETIFAAPDIQKQLPAESVLFTGVHTFWRDLMRRARDQRNCLKVSGAIYAGVATSSSTIGSTVPSSGAGHAVLDTMRKHNASLERIEKSLADYLETKRAAFPRFYFLANDELLAILAHAKEPHAVQRHLCKCFDALVKLELSDDASSSTSGSTPSGSALDIIAMMSPEGERVAFGRHLKARGNVEDWLSAVLLHMRTAVHKAIKSCLLDYQHAAREHWVFRHPAQAVAVVSYIIWARECDVCFRAASHDPVRELQLWHDTICTQLSNLTRLVRTSLTRLQRSVIVSLVTTDVHFRDVVADLVAKRVVAADDFAWTQQLRYAWNVDADACDVEQANCRIKYGYEYMGACSRLVITPLTDRCWMTITGALELRYGAAPSGPAGTGKTETAKDLAKALGILCIVFNCSDQIDYTMMGKIFHGVIQSGSWTCLDEFNRIDIEVLSVVAQQMHVLRHARLCGAHDVMFEGKRVPLRDHHVIVTMNPGYVGRTELPDNLKVCFRPVAMMVPDYAQIAEILLFAEGFQTAKLLSRKLTKLFKLCSEQLSQQPHYDFGMRSVKAVLTIAGTLKRAVATTAATSAATPSSLASHHVDENVLLIRAMSDATIPKFVDDDIVLFRGILRDLFPETLAVSSSISGDDALGGAANTNALASLDDEVGHQLAIHGLQTAPRWRQKILELFRTLNVRVGIVQTGASGSGKSTAMRILKAALTTLRDVKAHPSSAFERVVSFVLNPKAISIDELYGFFHPTTREWTDGLASSILRACIAEKSEQLLHAASTNKSSSEAPVDAGPYYWITFDGPIDVLWIESMNTVLDDNRTLCLANGERIKLLPRIHLLFEVLDTASASPATISRLGVVYYHPSHLGWRPFVETWAAALAVPVVGGVGQTTTVRLNAKHTARVLQYFDLFIDAGFAFLHSRNKPKDARAPETATASTSKVPIATSDLTFVTTICHIFESLLVHRAPPQLFAPASAASLASSVGGPSAAAAIAALETQQLRCLDLLFVFSFVWSFGGNLCVDAHKPSFEAFVLDLVVAHESFLSKDLLAVNGKIRTPPGLNEVMDNVQDFFIDFQYLSFSPWTNVVQATVPRALAYDPDVPLFQLLVPTPNVLRYTYLVELLVLDAKQPVLLTGATGSGKSVIVKHLLDARSRDNEAVVATTDASPVTPDSGSTVAATAPVLPVLLHFSAQTSSAVTQLSLESKFTKKRKTLLGAPPNRHVVVVCIDDVNLPRVERHGAQPPIELLRQFVEFRGFYDREQFFWKDVTDAVLLAVGGLPSGGRHALCQRFVRHFAAVFCLPSSDDASMRAIVGAIVTAHIACGPTLSKSVKDAMLQLVDATCELYAAVARDLLPTPSKCHYLFNLRDVTKLLQGVVIGTCRFCLTSGSGSGSTATSAAATLTVDSVAKLWAHESIRVFRDRLMDERDRRCFSEQLVQLVNSAFSCAWPLEAVYQNGSHEEAGRCPSTESTPDRYVPLLFGAASICNNSGSTMQTLEHTYDEIRDLDVLEAALDTAMTQRNAAMTTHNGSCDALKLVFFRDALVHVVAISRILLQPRGHALLLGMSGSGKRSLTRLCAFVHGYRCVEIDVRKSYGVADFRDDLKALMFETVLGAAKIQRRGRRDSSRRTSAAVATSSRTDATPTVLLLNDAQLVSDAFVDDINTLLSGGEIPKLFTLEERETIITEVRVLSSARAGQQQHGSAAPGSVQQPLDTGLSADASRKDCEAFFLAHVHKHLHIVLCLSPASDAFRARVRQFPSLINCTTIDVFDDWPSAALQYVADRFLSEPLSSSDRTSTKTIRDDALAPATKTALALLCVEMHRSIGRCVPAFLATCGRRVYVTPQHLLDVIALFKCVWRDKRALLDAKLERLTTGVVRLEETNALVHTLQDELVALQPVLAAKTREAETLLAQVSVDQAEASHVAARVALDESTVKRQQQDVAACQADAQSDLDRALPALSAAVSALDALDKKDITEVKGFVKPPMAVQVVMEAVCIMLGEKPDWDTSKRVLSRSAFMTDLKEYDKDNIPAATLKRVRKYIDSPEFAVDEVKKVSRAAMSLCMWVHAVDTYARVHKDVAPKRQRLEAMNAELADANATLEAKQLELADVVASVHALEATCDAAVAEKQRLVDEAELTHARLQRAEKLTLGLSDERVRWKQSIETLRSDATAVVGHSVLAAASVTYLGPFDARFRSTLVAHWVAFASDLLDVSSSFTLERAFDGASLELREWQLLGLPTDAVSAENAICIVKGTERWPLVIDPQQQASAWIQRMEAPYALEVVKCNDSDLAVVLERCLALGRPLLIEDVPETVEPTLEPILNRAALAAKSATHASATTKEPALAVVRLGDRVLDVDLQRFRLYMTTKVADPAFTPDVFIRMSVINFTVTRDGLEAQLLSDVVKHERPEVEARTHALLASIAQDQKLLQDLEGTILSLLSASNGTSILDDVELIHALETSKQTSRVVTQRLGDSKATKREVLNIRDQYAPVAARGALIYFVVANLAQLDPMYEHSLESFVRLFRASVDDAPASLVLPTRLANLTAHLTIVVYRTICRGLFEAHKLLFALVVCLRVQVMRCELSDHDVHLLDAAAVNFDTSASGSGSHSRSDSHASLLAVAGSSRSLQPQQQQASSSSIGSVSTDSSNAEALDFADVLVALSVHCTAFADVLDAYQREPSAWRDWLAAPDPMSARLPGDCDDRLPPFYRLVLIRWLRSDAFIDAATAYIRLHLGPEFVERERLAMADVYRDMDKRRPCLFILSTGADPQRIVDEFARDCAVFDDKYHVISLGQGQGPVAEAMLERCMRDGDWLVLLNVHLAKSWLPQLQQLLAAARTEPQSRDVHDDFRLFLASFPATYFPIAILQHSVKVICEPPKGIKANLRRSMALLNQAELGVDDSVMANVTVGVGSAATASDDAWCTRIEHQLAFGLSFFHAVIQERAKFGPLGWNLPYDFSDADLLSVLALQRRLLRGSQRSHRASARARRRSTRSDRESDSSAAAAAAGDRVGSDSDSADGSETDDRVAAAATRSHWIPWDALHFLTAEIYYGGRVTDEFDRRCLLANLLRFCSTSSLDLTRTSMAACPIEPHEMSAACAQLFPLHDDQFSCPVFESHSAMATFVDELPSMDAPFVFGMHPNAHIYFQQQETERLVGALSIVQPFVGSSSSASGSDSTRDGHDSSTSIQSLVSSSSLTSTDSVEAAVVSVALEIQATLPVPRMSAELKLTSTDNNGLVDPFVIVLHQELRQCYALLQFVHERLDALLNAIKGVVVMSHSLEDVAHSLSVHHVPLEWRRQDGTATVSTFTAFTASSTSPPLSHWVHQLVFRYEFLHAWRLDGAPPHNVFPLSIFCFPQGFFTAILQRHARTHRIPIHHLEFQFSVIARKDMPTVLPEDSEVVATDHDTSDGSSSSSSCAARDGDASNSATRDGAFISGMFLEGARWHDERHVLCDPAPGVMHHSMPIIHVLPHVIIDAAQPLVVSPTSRSKGAGRPLFGSMKARGSDGLVGIGGSSATTIAGASVRLAPTRRDAARRAKLQSGELQPGPFTYSCPVYKTPARKGTLSTTGISTNFVLAIELPCEYAPEHYALNGTALVCNISN